MTVVGTRPELIKLARVIPELDANFRHTLVHTGQNFDLGLKDVFFSDLNIRAPDFYLDAAGSSAAETIAQVLSRVDRVLEEVKPEAFLVLGDTNSSFAAIAAKKRRIPIFHMEAGNRCFDERVPEEVNRRIIDHLSDINLVYTEHARRNLLAEGLPSDRIIKTGSPMREVLDANRVGIDASAVMSRLRLSSRGFFLLSLHREENVDEPRHLEVIMDALTQIEREFSLPIVFSVHPRTRKRLSESQIKLPAGVMEFEPMGFHDYVKLQREAYCVLSDSGTLTEESSLLGFPAVTIRQAHERPEGMDVGTLVMSGLNPQGVLDAIRMVTSQAIERKVSPGSIDDYRNPHVSIQVARIVLSYTDYVRRRVWYQ